MLRNRGGGRAVFRPLPAHAAEYRGSSGKSQPLRARARRAGLAAGAAIWYSFLRRRAWCARDHPRTPPSARTCSNGSTSSICFCMEVATLNRRKLFTERHDARRLRAPARASFRVFRTALSDEPRVGHGKRPIFLCQISPPEAY